MAEPRHDFVRTYYRPLERTDFGELRRIAAEMEGQARERMGAADIVDIRMRHFLEVRYTGQDFSLPISVDPSCYGDGYASTVRDAFHQLHQTRFGYHDADLALEIVNAHLAAIASSTLDALPAPPQREGPAQIGRRSVIFDAETIDCPLYRRESLPRGEQIDGPAIIQEYASTTALFPQDRLEVMESGELLIHVGT
jgi:N-methylhydantoinase A